MITKFLSKNGMIFSHFLLNLSKKPMQVVYIYLNKEISRKCLKTKKPSSMESMLLEKTWKNFLNISIGSILDPDLILPIIFSSERPISLGKSVPLKLELVIMPCLVPFKSPHQEEFWLLLMPKKSTI